jgi:hypothetical protein
MFIGATEPHGWSYRWHHDVWTILLSHSEKTSKRPANTILRPNQGQIRAYDHLVTYRRIVLSNSERSELLIETFKLRSQTFDDYY